MCPDKLCKAILDGLVDQMKVDGRANGSFKGDSSAPMEVDDDNDMEIGEVNWPVNEDEAKHLE